MKFPVRPEKEEKLYQRMKELGVTEEDIDETFVRSSGPGGQSVNKTSTCVMIKHIPTGIVVKSQEARSQALNRFLARRMLVSRIEQSLLGKGSLEQKTIERIRKQKQRRKRRTRHRLRSCSASEKSWLHILGFGRFNDCRGIASRIQTQFRIFHKPCLSTSSRLWRLIVGIFSCFNVEYSKMKTSVYSPGISNSELISTMRRSNIWFKTMEQAE